MVPTTKAQRKAIFMVFQRDNPSYVTPRRRYQGLKPCPQCGYGTTPPALVRSNAYRRFRAAVQPGPGCLMLSWKGMWLGIEPDGYTHS